MGNALDSPPVDFSAYMADRLREYAVFEAAGLFWLGAELVILFAVAEAHRQLRDSSRLPSPRPSKGFLGRIFLYFAAFGLFCLPAAWAQFKQGGGNYTELWAMHITTWVIFVIGWVFLESMIVWKGVQAYLSLRVRLTLRPVTARALFLSLAFFLAFIAALSWPLYQSAMSAGVMQPGTPLAETKDLATFSDMIQPYENGKLFLLRIAGVVWISVEWVAAVVMCFAFYFLRRQVRA